MNKDEKDFIELVKNDLLELIEKSNSDYYEIRINKEDIEIYMSSLCTKLSDFDGDIWQLAEVLASTIFELSAPNLPGTGLVAYLVLKIFRKGIKTVCKDYTASASGGK